MRKCRVESNDGNSHTYRSIVVRETNEIIFSHLSDALLATFSFKWFFGFETTRFDAVVYSLPHTVQPIESV